jgi:hypothetical protein
VESESLRFDLLASSLRADLGDVASFVEALAAKLEATVPACVTVDRARNGFRGPKLVRKIALDLGGERLELRADRDQLRTLRAKVSGGIVIKTEPLDIEDWINAVTEALTVEAQRNERTRLALEQLLLDR